MDPTLIITLKLLAVAILVMLNGFFVAAEFALVKVRDTQLDALIAAGNARAATVRHVVHNLDRYLSAAQLGITLASLGLGWIGEPVFAALLKPVMAWFNITSPAWQHSLSFAVGFTSITFLHITAGEQAPKWLAIQKPMPSALFVSGPMVWFCRVAYPFIWALNQSSLWLLRQFGIEPAGEHEGGHSEDELRVLLTASQEHTHGTQLGRDIVLNALELRNRVARDVMRPRHEIVVMDTDASMTECIDIAEKTRFSRFPLCEQGNVDKALGVVHIKDVYAMRIMARSAADLKSVARKIVYVPETARLEKLLQLLLERKLHFAIVVDEFGGTLGMVTLENILEEVVGQIQDEFDQEIPLKLKVGENQWNIDGSLPLRELETITEETITAEDITTVNGWVTAQLGGFPKIKDTVKVGPHTLSVEEMDERRIKRLLLTLEKRVRTVDS